MIYIGTIIFDNYRDFNVYENTTFTLYMFFVVITLRVLHMIILQSITLGDSNSYTMTIKYPLSLRKCFVKVATIELLIL